MATITLAQLRSKLRNRLNSKTTDTRLTDANLNEVINEALRLVSLDADWWWLETLHTLSVVTGQETYTVGTDIPSDYQRTVSITHVDTGEPLGHRRASELDRFVIAGRPALYDSYGTTVVIKPTPNGSFSLRHRYIRDESLLSSDSDTPLTPLEYSKGVIEKAAAIAFDYIHDVERNAEAQKNYADWMIHVRDNNQRSREPVRIRVRPGSLW